MISSDIDFAPGSAARASATRAILLLAVLYSLSLVGHLGYLGTKGAGDLAWMRYPFMGFAKPFFLGLLLFAMWAINPAPLCKLRWTWWFGLIPLCLVLVELIHACDSPDSGRLAWQTVKQVMYVKYINSAISLALMLALIESALIAGLLDGRFLKVVVVMIAASLLIDLMLLFIGVPILSVELFSMVAWNNTLAYESAVALWILLAYRDKLDLENGARYVLILLLGAAGSFFSSRGALLLVVSLLLLHAYPAWRGQVAMAKGEKWVIYALLALNLFIMVKHYFYFTAYFEFHAALPALADFLNSGMIGGEQSLPISESDEVVSVIGRLAGILASLSVFKEHILWGAGADHVYAIDFHGIGIHSLWSLVLAAAGLAGALPAAALLGKFLYGAFRQGVLSAVIAAMTFLFFGLNMINQFQWWYALILMLCIHPFAFAKYELTSNPS